MARLGIAVRDFAGCGGRFHSNTERLVGSSTFYEPAPLCACRVADRRVCEDWFVGLVVVGGLSVDFESVLGRLDCRCDSCVKNCLDYALGSGPIGPAAIAESLKSSVVK